MSECNKCEFVYRDASDYMDIYEIEMHSKHHGCICLWEWKRQDSQDRYGYNHRVERANCPYHQVMF